MNDGFNDWHESFLSTINYPYNGYDMAQSAWEWQQKKIDELEKRLASFYVFEDISVGTLTHDWGEE